MAVAGREEEGDDSGVDAAAATGVLGGVREGSESNGGEEEMGDEDEDVEEDEDDAEYSDDDDVSWKVRALALALTLALTRTRTLTLATAGMTLRLSRLQRGEKKPAIWPCCRSTVMIWSSPWSSKIVATSAAEMGSRLRSFRVCRPYP